MLCGNSFYSLFLLFIEYWIEQVEVLPFPTRSMGAGMRSSCNIQNVVPYLFVQALHMSRFKNSSGVYRPKYEKNVFFACLAQHLSAFTSMCGTDTAGRGALEPPPEDGARTKLFDREFKFRGSHTPPADVICVIRSRKKTVLLSISGWRAETKHAQNDKTFQQNQTQ